MNNCTISMYYKIITVFIGPQLILRTSESQRVTLHEPGLFVLFLYLFPTLISFSVFMLWNCWSFQTVLKNCSSFNTSALMMNIFTHMVDIKSVTNESKISFSKINSCICLQMNISFLLDVYQNSTPGDVHIHMNSSR